MPNNRSNEERNDHTSNLKHSYPVNEDQFRHSDRQYEEDTQREQEDEYDETLQADSTVQYKQTNRSLESTVYMGQPNVNTESSLADTRYYGDVNGGQDRYEDYNNKDYDD